MTLILHYVVLTGAVALIALWPRSAPAEDLSSQIVGIWKVKSVECVDADRQRVFKAFEQTDTLLCIQQRWQVHQGVFLRRLRD